MFRFGWLVLILAAGTAYGGDTAIRPFTLPDAAGKPWSLHGNDAKATVVVFVGSSCPINTAYLPTLAALHREYAGRGVRFVGVHSLIHGTADELPFPVLRDAAQTVADLFDARRVPEVFVLDAGHAVRYRGRIDDQYGFDYKRPKPTKRFLADAIDAVLAGRPVAEAVTEVEGCRLTRAPKEKPGATVTYAKTVAAIFQKHCQECHRPGQIGPMPLLTHDDAVTWADMIAEVVRGRRMPPWHADPAHGTFVNDRRLSDAERDAILAWVDQGCAKGDERDMPPARTFADGWRIGTPDVVFEMPKTFPVPAEMPAKGVKYQYFVVDTNFAEDKWVQMAEAKPGAKEVVHHIIVFVTQPGKRRERTEDRVGEAFLVGYAPGDMPAVFPNGMAKRVPKGARLIFQMHYTPDGTAREDRSSVGLVFAKEPPEQEVRTRGIQVPEWLLAIPAGAGHHEVVARSTFPRDVLLLNFLPHMHLRGKDFRYEAVYPDGRREVLLNVPRYDFNWQSVYRLTEPKRLPAGTQIVCTAHYDNSANNKNNPDPKKLVRWGDQTWEEMMIGFVDYVPLGR